MSVYLHFFVTKSLFILVSCENYLEKEYFQLICTTLALYLACKESILLRHFIKIKKLK